MNVLHDEVKKGGKNRFDCQNEFRNSPTRQSLLNTVHNEVKSVFGNSTIQEVCLSTSLNN